MPEAIASFPGAETANEGADSTAQARDCSFRRFTQRCPQFAERHFDRLWVWPGEHALVYHSVERGETVLLVRSRIHLPSEQSVDLPAMVFRLALLPLLALPVFGLAQDIALQQQ